MAASHSGPNRDTREVTRTNGLRNEDTREMGSSGSSNDSRTLASNSLTTSIFMASLQIPQYFTTDFATNWEHLSQQMDSRLGASVMRDTIDGARKWYNQLDVGTMTEITTRKGDTPDGDSTGLKYWVFRRAFEFVRVWGEHDQINLGKIALPDSDEMRSAVYASNRTQDAVITQAFDGTRIIGELGDTSEAFNGASTQEVAVNYVPSGTPANSGLTLAKILRAKYIMDTNEVPNDGRYFVTSAQQLQDMLLVDKITSGDYMQVKGLVDGAITRFAGFQFIQYEGLPLNTSTDVRSAFAYHREGIKFVDGGREAHVDILPTKRHSKQLRMVYRCGAVRTEDKKIVRILCDQSPA